MYSQQPERPVQETTTVRRSPITGAPLSDSTAVADSILRARRLAADSAKAVADSLNPDSLRPVLPMLGPAPGPQPGGRRYVFGYDEIRWSGALTLGELLTLVPGVFVARSGGPGQGEVVSYAGQGAVSLEIYQDGYAIDPLGNDSSGFDTGRFDIGLLQRVEVDVMPSVLRVHLITDTQAARKARTEASFSSGDAQTNGYRVRYLNRWASGVGLNVSAAFLGTTGPLTSRGKVSLLQIMAKGMWMPNDVSGVEFEVNSYSYSRVEIQPLRGGGPALLGMDVRRSDLFVRAYTGTRPDGMGLRLDALLGSSSISDTSGLLDVTEGQASLTLGYRTSHWSAETWSRVRDSSNPFDLGARAAWSPLRFLSVSGYARRRAMLGNGGLTETDLAAELRPVSWFALHGDVRHRVVDDSAFVSADTTERVGDWTAGAAFTTRILALDVGYGHRGEFTAPVFGIFSEQIPNTRTVEANALMASWQVRPWPWITLSGWLRQPDNDSIPFDPPNHSVTKLTLRSAFLPHFRRNAFDAMAQLEIEAWGSGVAGFDGTGAPIKLPGRTIYSTHVQFRLVGALLFWTLRNALRDPYSHLPGFELPRSFQRFGVRWEFTN